MSSLRHGRRACLCGRRSRPGHVTFTIATNAAAAPTIVQVTAAIQNVPSTANLSVNAATPPGPSLWFGLTRTTTITLTRGAPAQADRVKITKARWKAGLLTIEATSTKPNAILSVYSQSGDFMFTLTNQGGGKYFDQRGFVFNPEVITVRSNLGGTATKTLTS